VICSKEEQSFADSGLVVYGKEEQSFADEELRSADSGLVVYWEDYEVTEMQQGGGDLLLQDVKEPLQGDEDLLF